MIARFMPYDKVHLCAGIVRRTSRAIRIPIRDAQLR
jgi:hypothetical protein